MSFSWNTQKQRPPLPRPYADVTGNFSSWEQMSNSSSQLPQLPHPFPFEAENYSAVQDPSAFPYPTEQLLILQQIKTIFMGIHHFRLLLKPALSLFKAILLLSRVFILLLFPHQISWRVAFHPLNRCLGGCKIILPFQVFSLLRLLLR
jgi:hypothetical protein